MGMISAVAASCGRVSTSENETPWIVDRFDDIKVIRYEVPGFDRLPLQEKELVYYLSEAAKCGRDILFDQNFKYNLAVRRTLETIYEHYVAFITIIPTTSSYPSSLRSISVRSLRPFPTSASAN